MTARFLAAFFFVFAACAQTPEWIWFGEGSQTNATTVYFRKTFRTPPLIWNSRLTVTADDQAEVFLNGVSVARCVDWQRPSRSEVTVRLNQGENVIAVKAQVKEGARGLLVHLNLAGEMNLVSDSSWLTSTREEQGWSTLSFNAASWQNAHVLGPHGIKPWGDVLFRAAATAPELITAPADFRVELLRSAEPAEGSWICMTFDDRGRIILSPQGEGKPLLRVTLKENKVAAVENIEAPISYAMGLLHAFDSLYVNGIGPRGAGLYRLIDANKNDRYETNELHFLKGFKGGSEHGYHALVLGPDKKIYVLNGNSTKLPEGISTNSPYRNYAEDSLTGARADDLPGTTAPNCHVLRTDAEGKAWELFAGGMRNSYDFDFNEDGELFTFDSDNEWDWGVPWYRPTRIIHLVSGGEAGWRDGTRMWAEHYQDALATIAYVGIGSPTGVKFAKGTHFPEHYRRALFVQDWSYGRILAVHVDPAGATYTGHVEPFLSGAPLNVTSLSFGPDGAMYFITGGRGTQSGLYRVAYSAPPTSEKEPRVARSTGRYENQTRRPAPHQRLAREQGSGEARKLRHQLESLHSSPSIQQLEFTWTNLLSSDSAILFAARVALEALPVDLWKDRALAEPQLHRSLTALLALARVGSVEDQTLLHRRLLALPLRDLSEGIQLAKLRIIQISLARHGKPSPEITERLTSELDPAYPSPFNELNRELCRILLALDAPNALSKTITLLLQSGSSEQQLFYVEQLRNVPHGWTPADRDIFFSWFRKSRDHSRNDLRVYFDDVGRKFVEGAGYDRYLRDFRREAISTLSPNEKKQLQQLLALPITQAQTVPSNPRPFVRAWKLEDLIPELGKPRRPDLARGRQAFVDAQCLTCHRFGNDGGVSGPELTGAASKYSERDLLEAILEPSKIISDQYQDHTVFVKDGEVFTGRLVSDSGDEIIIETDRTAGTTEKIPRSQVEQIRPAAFSPMPQGLVNVLTQDEILDLLSYLKTGTANSE